MENQAWYKPLQAWKELWESHLLLTDFLLCLLFAPEDGGDIFLQNIGLSPDYMVLHLRRSESSQSMLWELQFKPLEQCSKLRIWLPLYECRI
jgi:hypothetical protein